MIPRSYERRIDGTRRAIEANMKNDDALRAEYRNLRNACDQMSAKEFDFQCRVLAHELADGEDMTPAVWVRAAREISRA